MWSKYRSLVGLCVTVGASGGAIYAVREVVHAQAMPTGPHSPTWVRSTECPFKTWDDNWDRRATVKKSKGSGDGKEVVKEGKSSRAVRHLILIRHGQYNLDGKTDDARTLTPLGKMQAQAVGERLKSLNLPYTIMVNSTMARATETSNIIYETLGLPLPRKSMKNLEEGAPAIPEPRSKSYDKSESTIFRDGARIESAFRELFHRPSPDAKDDTYEIVVCHANVIRYFVCRALQFPPEAWLRFSLRHCSITWFTIHGNGFVSARSVGDAGFLHPSKITSS